MYRVVTADLLLAPMLVYRIGWRNTHEVVTSVLERIIYICVICQPKSLSILIFVRVIVFYFVRVVATDAYSSIVQVVAHTIMGQGAGAAFGSSSPLLKYISKADQYRICLAYVLRVMYGNSTMT